MTFQPNGQSDMAPFSAKLAQKKETAPCPHSEWVNTAFKMGALTWVSRVF